MSSEIIEISRPILNSPVLITGLPGAGYVAKLAVDHLISELKAQKISEIYSHHLPPQVFIKSDGSSEPMKNDFFSWTDPSAEVDLILFTGHAQATTSEGEYEIAEKVLDYAKNLGVKRVFSLAAYITGAAVNEPKVYGTTTTSAQLKELTKTGVLPMNEGTITGMNGLLFALGRIKGIEGTCLLGETSGYYIDPRAAQAVLTALTTKLGIRVNLDDLGKRAKETERIVKSIEEEQEHQSDEGNTVDNSMQYIS